MLHFVPIWSFFSLHEVRFAVSSSIDWKAYIHKERAIMTNPVGSLVSYRDWLRDEEEADTPRQRFSSTLDRADTPKGAERIQLMRDSRRQLPQGRITR
jgi:hypothetical protein